MCAGKEGVDIFYFIILGLDIMMRKLFFAFIFVIMMWSFDARSNEPIDFFGDWAVFATYQDNKLLCYTISVPSSSKTDYNNRGKPFITVIKERNKTIPEINVSVGYIISDSVGSVELQVKNDKYPLINFQDRAWAYDMEDDKAIIENLLKSATFAIYSKNDANKYSIDIYSLNGFVEAYNTMMLLCKSE